MKKHYAMDKNIELEFLKNSLVVEVSNINFICNELSTWIGERKTAELKGCILDLMFIVNKLAR